MLVNVMLNDSLIYAIGVFGMLGIVAKMVVSMTLNRLVKSASNMSKSNHKFMKLVKAKFEHATMANNGVDNVPVFVDKYIHEYKTLGMTLHSWQKIQRISLAIVTISGVIGCALAWYLGFGSTTVLEYATVGIGSIIILLAIYQVVDENHRIIGLRIYMVDYLENVLASRYEKAKVKNGVANRIQMEENLTHGDRLLDEDAQTKILPNIDTKTNVDKINGNNEFPQENVDNFDTSIIPSLKIKREIERKNSQNHKDIQEEKIVVTNTGFGWLPEEGNSLPVEGEESVISGAVTEASYTGVTTQEATEILTNRIQAVRSAKSADINSGYSNKERDKEMQAPKFHIQTLEEPQLTAMEQMLQDEAQKRTIAKEQAGTKTSVNSLMIREILEEFMS